MKLLIITASTAFDKNIKEILKKSEVKTFSYKKVKGYRDMTEESVSNNWFATEMNENESTLFYAFIKKENVDQVFERVSQFNAKQETISRIHIALLNVEKSNKYEKQNIQGNCWEFYSNQFATCHLYKY